MLRSARFFPILGLLVALCIVPALRPNSIPAGRHQAQGPQVAAGTSGGPETEPAPRSPDGPLTSPSGRVWQWGETDELGYVLPLDVRRPRPPRALGEAPARPEILARRETTRALSRLFEEHRVSPDDGHTQNETSIDASGDSIVSAWHLYTAGSLLLGIGRSVDGGHVWQEAVVSGSHTNLTDPCVKSGGGGRWYLSYLGTGGTYGSDYDVFLRSSTDAGLTWSLPVAVTNDANFDDKPYLAARGNDLLIGYADFAFSPAKTRVVRSTNGGLSFDHDTILANNSVGGNGACPVILPDGTYAVFWRDSFQDSLWISRSTDHGLTWSADRGIAPMSPLPSLLPGGFRMINIPSAAADPITGDLVVVWNDQRFGDPDIISVRSTDGGLTWSTPIRVNDDPGTAAQFFPWIVFDPHGVAHVCWYDRRENGSDIDVYYARSTDRGASFEPNIRVTAAPYTPILPWDTTVAFIGDYNGIAASGTTVFPCYQDAREGNQDVYVALLPGGPPAGVAAPQTDGTPAPVLAAAPNPFSATVRLGVTGSTAGTVLVIEVFTPEGRRVRELRLDGERHAVWDGRDETGAPVSRGVYFARFGGGGEGLRLVKVD